MRICQGYYNEKGNKTKKKYLPIVVRLGIELPEIQFSVKNYYTRTIIICMYIICMKHEP